MKLFILPLLVVSVVAVVLQQDPCDASCDPKCGPLGHFSSEELKAELQRRETATGCTSTVAPDTSTTTTATTTTTTLHLHPACTVQDGSGPSAEYPCNCGEMDSTGAACHNGDICTGSGGGAASPAPAPATFLQRSSKQSPAPAPLSKDGGSGNCAPPPDNFADELTDQGDVPFETLDMDKDGCLTEFELTDHLREQRDVHRSRGYYWQEEHIEEHHDDLTDNTHEEHAHADEDKNGCLSKAEYEKMQKSGRDCPKQFMMMDLNADEQISRQEAMTYLTDHTDGGSLNYDKFRAIFEAADVNKDNFLSKQEFCDAGPKYSGDGNEAF